MTHGRKQERGFALLMVYVMAASIAITLYMEMPRVAFESQRAKEQLLMDRGNQYKRAIQVFFRKNKRFPASIDELESFQNVRSLRRKYKDPFTGKDEWRIIHVGPSGVLTDSLIQKPNPLGKDGAAGQTASVSPGFATSRDAAATGQPGATGVVNINGTDGSGLNMALARRPSDHVIGGVPGQVNPAPVEGDPNQVQNQPPPPAPSPDPNQYPGQNYPGQNYPGQNQAGQMPGQLPGQMLPNSNGMNPNQPNPNQPNPNQLYPPNPGQPVYQNQPYPQNPGQPVYQNQPYPPNPGQPGFPNQPNPNQPYPNPAYGQPGAPTYPTQVIQNGAPGQPYSYAPGGQPVPVQPGQPYSYQPNQPYNQNQYNQNQNAPNQPYNPLPFGRPGSNAPVQVNSPPGFGPGQNGGQQNPAISAIQNALFSPRQPPSGIGTSNATLGAGGIAGVATTYKGASIKTVNDRHKYQEWEFVYDIKKDKSVMGNGAGQMPGQNGANPVNPGINNGPGPSSGFGSGNGNTFGQPTSPGFGGGQPAVPVNRQP